MEHFGNKNKGRYIKSCEEFRHFRLQYVAQYNDSTIYASDLYVLSFLYQINFSDAF